MSHVESRGDRLQLAATVVDLHGPVNTLPASFQGCRPRGNLVSQSPDVANSATAQTLARHGAQLILSAVQPTAMILRLAELAPGNRPRARDASNALWNAPFV